MIYTSWKNWDNLVVWIVNYELVLREDTYFTFWGTEVNKFGLRQVGVYKFWRLKGKTSVKYVSSLIMPMSLYVYLHEEYN